ncbi:MAG: SAM-dependent chlorinase/fluorinase [Alphaproteobacteria bacterium]|nr:SAM-dependent chlorinase/fluorinase [Alphaproteobacteria bacterium]
MIVFFTDFGASGPYVGALHMAAARVAPDVSRVDLLHEAPAFLVRESAYLLAALSVDLPPGAVCVAVVDPGVGNEAPEDVANPENQAMARQPVVLEADERIFVGPGNGLLEIMARRAKQAVWRRLTYKPKTPPSATFHGRDIFAPAGAAIAAALAEGRPWRDQLCAPIEGVEPALVRGAAAAWPDDLAAVITCDGFGNAMTGLRAETLNPAARLRIGGAVLHRARSFADMERGAPFWYENAYGLVEIAANQGDAAALLGLSVGDPVSVVTA